MRPEYRTDNAWVLFDEIVEDLARRDDVSRVCDVGAGANPALPLDFIHAHALDYILLDVSAEELEKAPSGYRTRVGSVLDAPQDGNGKYDLILSRSVIEHFEDAARLHSVLFRMAAPGGWAVHLFPTLYALPFVVNRLLPEEAAEKALLAVMPSRVPAGHLRKFPAYYKWCRGPSRRQIARFSSIGWTVERYIGFFIHPYYDRVAPLRALHHRLAEALVRHPVASLTSFAVLVLRKPPSTGAPAQTRP